MAQTFSRFIAIGLLGAMVVAGAGAACWLPASVAPLHTAGCHSSRVPADHQPGDYGCCISQHPLALLTGASSPRPGLQLVVADTIDVPVTASRSNAMLDFSSYRGGPPGVLNLKI